MRFNLDPDGPFSLEVARTFACGLFVASRTCTTDGAVRFAFSRDDDFALAGVKLTYDGRRVRGDAVGAVEGVEKQVARVIGVDRDAQAFYALGERDPVVAGLFARSPGFRPVVFFSPWAAAGWAVLTQRLRMSQAARIAVSLARECADVVQIDGESVAAFPRPHTFLSRSGFEGLSGEKWSRLQAVARAALEGRLSLEALAEDGARERLLQLPGVGRWTADAVMIRGVGPSDVLPDSEPMLHQAVEASYGPAASLDEVTEGWRPFRTWVSIMLMRDFMRSSRPAPAPRPMRASSSKTRRFRG
jgi:DNA-3-methyladenine glycosylase II